MKKQRNIVDLGRKGRPLVRSAQPNPTVVPIGESPMARLIKKTITDGVSR